MHVVRDILFGVRIAFDAVAAQFAGRNRMRMNAIILRRRDVLSSSFAM